MKTILANAEAVRAAVAAGDFCDCGHYYCARQEGGRVVWPSGAVLDAAGVFRGPARLLETLAAIPADYRPDPVAPCDRYPERGAGWEERRCAPADAL
jgi:hypothetical protein